MENKVGTKIKEARKMKGYSQEELAGSSGVSLRTIQRVENNESDPRGKTLQLLCEALEINVEDILDYGKEVDRDFLMFFHISVTSFLLIPLGNIILPLILWLTKKDKVVGLDRIGRKTLNFQIIWSVLAYGSALIFAFYKIQNIGEPTFLIYFYIVLVAINVILAIFYAISSRTGNVNRTYPSLIKIIS